MRWNWWLNKKHSWEVMDEAARRLGAPDAREFLSLASPSLKCAFKLVCDLIAKHEPPAGSPEREYIDYVEGLRDAA